jgi:WD40 repeat protein
LALKLRGSVYLAFSRDGRRVLTANGTGGYGRPFKHGEEPAGFMNNRQAQVWDPNTGKPVGAPLRHDKLVCHAEFSPDGRRVVTASDDKTARVWNAETGEPVTPPLPHGADVTCAAFSPDGRRVATASADRTARVWNAETGEPVGTPLKHGGTPHMTQAFFDERGCRVVVVLDREARVWDVTRGQPATPLLKHRARVNGAVFSPDGRRVVTASDDGTARVWDAATGEPVTPLLPHGGRTNYNPFANGHSEVPQASFIPDGRRLITVSWSAAQNWDLRPDVRPAEDLVRLAVLLSGHQVDNSGGYVPVSKDVLVDAWKTLQAKYPGEFTTPAEALSWQK